MGKFEQTLIIRHVGDLQFVVARLEDGKTSAPVSLEAPDSISVGGRPDSHLMADLRWYLENFLDYPYEPNTEIAEQILSTLDNWGRSSFERLFTGQPLLWYDRIRNSGLPNLALKIASDDPLILAWPWEALRDPHGTTIAHTCRLERQLCELHDPLPLPAGLSRTEVNILLVIARPYGDDDAGFHAVSGPLVDWVRTERPPVRIDVLRPPTFRALQDCLRSRPGHYHIVHFDGHGGYGETNPRRSRHEFGGVQGLLVFENNDGGPSLVPAHKLTALLAEYRIPIMVLNACRSALIDSRAGDPFASTAAALLRAGIRSVVAMGYNLYVSGAERFVSAFYRRLLRSGQAAEAMRAGRQAMLENDHRTCARGEYPLQDWLVPVLYQQEEVPLPIQSQTRSVPTTNDPLPEEQSLGDYGFIGRQNAILKLERALQCQPAAAVLIHGMAGIGKTTLVRGFIRWLQNTNGLPSAGDSAAGNPLMIGVIWFAFDDIRGAEYVINRLLTATRCHDAAAWPLKRKLPVLVQSLRQQPLLIVWDNFETASGVEGTAIAPSLLGSDRALLEDLLIQLRGGRSKILITSRSSEGRLSSTAVFRLQLHGLRGEDVWEYCNAVLRDLGLRVDRNDADCLALIEELDGHPLALRSVLLRLAEIPARELLIRLKERFSGQIGDESTRRISAVLELFDQGLPAEYGPVLRMVGLHRRYVDMKFLAHVMQFADESAGRQTLNRCFDTLERGGLIHQACVGVYRMHPALGDFLAVAHPPEGEDVERFVASMADFASAFADQELYDQRPVFAIQGANFRCALTSATRLDKFIATCQLTHSLASFAHNSGDLGSARASYGKLGQTLLTAGDEVRAAHAYHELGVIAQEEHDLEAAEEWYRKALVIWERHVDERRAAMGYIQLGDIAQDRRDFDAAELWFLKALAIGERLGNAGIEAISCHQLARISEDRRDFAKAESLYLKSLAITKQREDQYAAARTYHQLGMVAHAQRDFDKAKCRYLESLAISEQREDASSSAATYHQLGMISRERGELENAERWCIKSLAIKEKCGDELGAAITYAELGVIALQANILDTAKQWYEKSLAIRNKYGDEHGTAIIFHQFGVIAQAQRAFDEAEMWYFKALKIKESERDEHSAATTYYQLGRVAQERNDPVLGGEWTTKSIVAFVKHKDLYSLKVSVDNFVRIFRSANKSAQESLRALWRAAGLDAHIRLEGLDES